MQRTIDELLRATSRSFYLTLRVLPRAVRSQIGLAYLLARTTDTIADTEIVPSAQRLVALAALRGRILGQGAAPLNFGELAGHQVLTGERVLLERIEDSLVLLRTLSADDLALVRKVIDTITGGQELDLKRFATSALVPSRSPGEKVVVRAEPPARIIALRTEAELDDYTYRVAGCVGEFWTRMCRRHLFSNAALDDGRLFADGVRFGKGLQLVNILRDLPCDLRQGRCYIPTERLALAGLRPEDLLKPEAEAKFRPVYRELLARAEAHLAAGWVYTNTIPRNQWRVRLACAWPILIGVRTVELLYERNVLDPARRIKVARAEVRGIMLRSLARVPFPGAFHNLWNPPDGVLGKAVASTTDLP